MVSKASADRDVQVAKAEAQVRNEHAQPPAELLSVVSAALVC